jgi:hypothetical protein
MVNKNIVFEIYTMMERQNILLSFIGDFNLAITDALLHIANPKNAIDKEVTAKTKVYKIMVECLENICKHSDVIDQDNSPSLFYLSKSTDHFYVITGNYIMNKNIIKLKGDIDLLNSMNKEEVRERYRSILKLGRISEKNGAGVGIIDIVMKADNKLEYLFMPHSDDYSFYILKVPVKI